MNDEEFEPTVWDRLAPTVFSIATMVMIVAFFAAGLAALYLIYGVFTKQLANVESLPPPDRARVLGVVSLATQVLTAGLAVGTLAMSILLFIEETTGYIILGAAIAVGFGIQFAFQTFGGTIAGEGMQRAFAAFQTASLLPAAFGALLVGWDVFKRYKSALTAKEINVDQLTFGSEARAERLPMRTSIFAKCWEGPYCRESIRVHCPIFQERKSCWKELRGCYCEEDIVIEAARKAESATPLPMAPDPQFNFTNSPNPGLSTVGSGGTIATGGGPIIMSIGSAGVAPDEEVFARKMSSSMTDGQKRERCKNCIIYNEHMRDKYKIMMPAVLGGGVALCVLLSPLMREGIGLAFVGMERLANQIAISSSPTAHFSRPPEPIEWAMVGAFSLMIVSKMLQTLEWVCFKAKI